MAPAAISSLAHTIAVIGVSSCRKRLVAWLPLNHDMGLVGCLWMAVSTGLDLRLFNPSAFLSRPLRWLQELAAHGKAGAIDLSPLGHQNGMFSMLPISKEQILELQANPHKRVKGISLDSALGRISFLRLRTGFWFAHGTELLFYPIPDHTTLESEHYEWFRSLAQ